MEINTRVKLRYMIEFFSINSLCHQTLNANLSCSFLYANVSVKLVSSTLVSGVEFVASWSIWNYKKLYIKGGKRQTE